MQRQALAPRCNHFAVLVNASLSSVLLLAAPLRAESVTYTILEFSGGGEYSTSFGGTQQARGGPTVRLQRMARLASSTTRIFFPVLGSPVRWGYHPATTYPLTD